MSWRQKTLAVTIPYRGSKGPLNLLVDSTGIKAEGAGEWHARNTWWRETATMAQG
ncbi:putative transposase [Citreicella sp. 357]|nr:putative transposase [Citreicella sp. 357]